MNENKRNFDEVVDEMQDFIMNLVDGAKGAIIAYVVIGLITFVISGILFRIPTVVDWFYDETGLGKTGVKFQQIYSEEFISDSINIDWSWALSQIVYGDYYTARERAMAEQILAEKRGEHLDSITVYGRGDNVYTFPAYDIGRDESEYEWHNGESWVSLPITSSFGEVKMDAYNSIYYSDMVCSIEDKVYPYTSHEIDEVLSDIDLIIYDGLVRSNKDELDVDIEYIKYDSVALLRSLVG